MSHPLLQNISFNAVCDRLDEIYSEGSSSKPVPSWKQIIKCWRRKRYKTTDPTRSNRGEIPGNPFWTHTSSLQSMQANSYLQWDLNVVRRPRNLKQAREIRTRTLEQFTVDPRIVEKLQSKSFSWVNQGGCGGCAFACISIMSQLANFYLPWDVKTIVSSRKFKKLYVGKFNFDCNGYRDWITTFEQDFGPTIPHFNMTMAAVKYCPLKIRGAHNKSLFGEGLTKSDYGRAVFDHIKGLLDTGHIVGIPFLEHFITVIGYRNDQLLFCGSYGEKWDQGGLHIMDPTFNPVMLGDALQEILVAKL